MLGLTKRPDLIVLAALLVPAQISTAADEICPVVEMMNFGSYSLYYAVERDSTASPGMHCENPAMYEGPPGLPPGDCETGIGCLDSSLFIRTSKLPRSNRPIGQLVPILDHKLGPLTRIPPTVMSENRGVIELPTLKRKFTRDKEVVYVELFGFDVRPDKVKVVPGGVRPNGHEEFKKQKPFFVGTGCQVEPKPSETGEYKDVEATLVDPKIPYYYQTSLLGRTYFFRTKEPAK